MDAAWVEIAATLFLGAIVAYFANNHARQTKVQLADARRKAYATLWEITYIATPSRLEDAGWRGALSEAERIRLQQELTAWYYQDGNGMLLGKTTRQFYLKVKHNLTCDDGDLEPRNALVRWPVKHSATTGVKNLKRLRPYGPLRANPCLHPKRTREYCPPVKSSSGFGLLDLFPTEMLIDERRGCLSIRQLSLLRTQMKTDLAVYGMPWSKGLSLHERAFLIDCEVRLHRNRVDAAIRNFVSWVLQRDRDPWIDAAGRPVHDECCGGKISPIRQKRRIVIAENHQLRRSQAVILQNRCRPVIPRSKTPE